MKNKHHKDYPVGSPMNVTLKLVLADDPLLNDFNVISWFYLGQGVYNFGRVQGDECLTFHYLLLSVVSFWNRWEIGYNSS